MQDERLAQSRTLRIPINCLRKSNMQTLTRVYGWRRVGTFTFEESRIPPGTVRTMTQALQPFDVPGLDTPPDVGRGQTISGWSSRFRLTSKSLRGFIIKQADNKLALASPLGTRTEVTHIGKDLFVTCQNR